MLVKAELAPVPYRRCTDCGSVALLGIAPVSLVLPLSGAVLGLSLA